MSMRKNHYTKWYVLPVMARMEDGVLLGKEPKGIGYPGDVDDPNNGDLYIPVLSTRAGWRRNREWLRRYAENTGALWSFLQWKNHWPLLRRCFGRHLKPVMRELITEFNIQDEDARSILSWDTTRFPNPREPEASHIYDIEEGC